jgi:fructokinase
MKMEDSGRSVVCFGEILWDNLPEGRNPGGAPMNVAYHLHKLGVKSHLISSVGDDAAGAALLDFLKGKGLSTNFIQTDTAHKTSEVAAAVNNNNEVSYTILPDVAWDYIHMDTSFADTIRNADAFVFGSLSSRTGESRETLLQMVSIARYRVFDVNLREPHYTPERIMALLAHADLLKVNADELEHIAHWANCRSDTDADTIQQLFNAFPVKEILVTRGSHGATYYNAFLTYNYPAYSVTVKDTIGSGDSFLAAFLAMKLSEAPLEVVLDYAAAMGAFITAQSGACPEYSKSDLDRFLWKRKLGI